eukprot:TRINITY_DN10818_c0_g1_i1.p1 TRINITY_DN10818_c0_g1~~TRINITY_DN10818_c0_g1_i1.p1  ORF type:complete len:217 (-),score=34.66 TRINITY_DN10818_c0_g1_i1:21-638(-)
MKLLLLLATILALSVANLNIPEDFTVKYTMTQTYGVDVLEVEGTIYQNLETGFQRTDSIFGTNKSQTFYIQHLDGTSTIYFIADGTCNKVGSDGPIMPLFDFVKNSKYTEPCKVNLAKGNNYYKFDNTFSFNICVGIHGDKADTPLGMILESKTPSSQAFETVVFDSFTPGAPQPSVFNIPKICDGVETVMKRGITPIYSSLFSL